MGLLVNHNMMAMNAANNLNMTYDRLSQSVSRLSSGLRINSAADDAAGLAVRELMRSDIRVLNQGIRNAQDAINMLQTADGAMAVIDEKLIRMKELAEQAATGTYTTAQRAIMDAEYQAMASEITRIANATDFNGIKLLDGSLSALHGGSGLKIHFGTGNDSMEDYYYVDLDDMTASALGVTGASGGGSADVATNVNSWSSSTSALGLDGYFSFYYNNDGDTSQSEVEDVVALYQVTSGMSLNDVATQINGGTAARGTITFTDTTVSAGDTIVVDGVTYEFTQTVASMANSGTAVAVLLTSGGATSIVADMASVATLLHNAINDNGGGAVWAVMSGGAVSSADPSIMIMAKTPGAEGNNTIQVQATGVTGTFDWGHVGGSTNALTADSNYLQAGGSAWLTATVTTYTNQLGSTVYSLELTGEDGHTATASYTIAAVLLSGDANFSADFGTNFAANLGQNDAGTDNWSIQTGSPAGAGSITTQSGAQEMLSIIDAAIVTKDTARAKAGYTANRLSNTVTALTLQAENLQASEAQISDADVALEMTEFTRNMILAQSGVAMLAQANSIANLALQLLGG